MARKPTMMTLCAGALAALALAGCSTGGPGGDDGSAGGNDGELDSVALMVSDLSNPFFSAMQDAVEEAADEQGFEVNVQDGRQDLSAQNEQIDALIQQGIDVLLLNAADSAGIAPAVERATEAGIVVVAVGDQAEGAQVLAAVNNVQAGERACQFMAEELGNKGEVAIIDGTAVSAVQQRVEGCQAALKEIPGIEVVATQNGDNSIGEAQIIATDVLTANPDLGGIFGINDPTALGALAAAEDAGFSDLVIVGVDGSPDAVAALQSESMFFGTATQDPRAMVTEGLAASETLFAGDELDETDILLDSMFVTRDNLSEYTPW